MLAAFISAPPPLDALMPVRSNRNARGRASCSIHPVKTSTKHTGHALRRWRRELRPRALRMAIKAIGTIPWSPTLLRLLADELYVEDSLEALLNARLERLHERRYPEAIAAALILRHSWHPDDLSCILKRLRLAVDEA